MVAKDKFRPKKDVTIATLPIITKEFTMSLEMNASSFSNAYHNIIHMTKKGNGDIYGDRIPLVGINGARAVISYAVNDNKNYHKYININKNEWVSFEVSQRHERTGEYRYKVLKNGAEENAFSTINRRPLDFEHVLVYASDPWYVSFDGLIRNIEVCIAGKYILIYTLINLTGHLKIYFLLL